MSYLVLFVFDVFFFKQKTAYEMRISDWSSDVCSSDLQSMLVTDRVSLKVCQRSLLRSPEQGSPGRKRKQSDAADPAPPAKVSRSFQIGRASCRERECQYV